MDTTIEAADINTEADARYVREEVFGREWRLTLPPLHGDDPNHILTLIARRYDTNEPIAALSVIDTTGNRSLHRRLGLSFNDAVKVARYTQLAVLKPFRGMNIPALLILEARRRVVRAHSFAFTWLLFSADKAKGSSMCTLLGFEASAHTTQTEYGRSRVLVRAEGPTAEIWDRNATDYLNGAGHFNSTAPPTVPLFAVIRPGSRKTNGWPINAVLSGNGKAQEFNSEGNRNEM